MQIYTATQTTHTHSQSLRTRKPIASSCI